jgi:hypothetical protein
MRPPRTNIADGIDDFGENLNTVLSGDSDGSPLFCLPY